MMDTKKTLKALIHLYKEVSEVSNALEIALGNSPNRLDDVCSNISNLMRKQAGMPDEDMKLSKEVTKDDYIFCGDYYKDLLFEYGQGECELTEYEIINEFISWDNYLKNYKICEEGNLYCSCEKPLLTRWADEVNVFAVCSTCNEGHIAQLFLDKK
ncbi:hypothetical protein [Cytobacillus oceanisediminis]|uniref:hypothetical protein n=1 Tax=Cytobacillus oceanisediminis TaxID=665099 RepID=UPI001C21402D|nr:hypothetical protein [Cytobacillus oceanisediminis]MBU8770346.1 hypothetical protein [Cytobacillus oceanisediminis]